MLDEVQRELAEEAHLQHEIDNILDTIEREETIPDSVKKPEKSPEDQVPEIPESEEPEQKEEIPKEIEPSSEDIDDILDEVENELERERTKDEHKETWEEIPESEKQEPMDELDIPKEVEPSNDDIDDLLDEVEKELGHERSQDEPKETSEFDKGNTSHIDELLYEVENELEKEKIIDDILDEVERKLAEEYVDQLLDEIDQKVVERERLERPKDAPEGEDLERYQSEEVGAKAIDNSVQEIPDEKEEELTRGNKETCADIGDEKVDPVEDRKLNEQLIAIDSKDAFTKALEHHPDIRFRKQFVEEYRASELFFDCGMEDIIPSLVKEIEYHEMRRLYEEANDGPPMVEIDSMIDVAAFLSKHQKGQETIHSEQYKRTETYFAVKDDKSKLQRELAETFGVSQQRISDYQSGKETSLISNLRQHEEDLIIKKWAKTDLRGYLRIRNTTSPEIVKPSTNNEIEKTNEREIRPLHRVESSRIIERLPMRDLESYTVDEITTGIKEICYEISRTKTKIAYMDLSSSDLENEQQSRISGLIKENRVKIESKLREQLGLKESDKSVRIGIVDDKVYIWNPDLTPDDMINAWAEQYFYFNTKDLAKMILKVGEQLQTNKNDYENLQHLNELIQQMISDRPWNRIKVKGNETRVLGEVLHLQCDIIGCSPREFESIILQVTGDNGQGGIDNPKILRGEELEGLRADLIATALSDCALRENGRLQYYEADLDRIHIVDEALNEFGNISLNIRYRADRNIYSITFPRPFGKALLFWGAPYGDKTIKNPCMPPIITNGSLRGKAKYLGGLVPEEGSIDKRVSWTRSNAAHAGIKSEEYNFEPKISQEEIDLVISEGRHDPEDLEGKIYLRWSEIDSLMKANDSNAEVARKLRQTFTNNPNRLIMGEQKIAQDFGIEIRIDPEMVSYYEKTGRVSVKWTAKTRTIKDTIRWGIACPPNDVRKKEKMKEILSKRKDLVKEVTKDLKNEGIQYNEWWID